MSVIIHLMGKVTKDPVMQQRRNNGRTIPAGNDGGTAESSQ